MSLVEAAKEIVDFYSNENNVSDYVQSSEELMEFAKAMLEANDIFSIAESGVSIKWRAVKWLEKYGRGK